MQPNWETAEPTSSQALPGDPLLAPLGGEGSQIRTLLDGFPDALVRLEGNKVTFHNDAFRSLTGCTDEREMDETPFLDWLLPEDKPHFLKWLSSRSDDRAAATLAMRVRGKLGTSFTEVRRIRVNLNGWSGALLAMRDVTELRRVQAEAEAHERFADLGRLVAGVAHEINNPLGFMMPNLESLLRAFRKHPLGTPLSASARAEMEDMAQDALVAATRISRIVTDLRTFHKVDTATESVDLNELVESVLRLAKPKLQSKVRIERDFGTVPKCRINAGRLHQVLLNLIVNATQAMPDERALEHNLIRVTTRFRGDKLLVTVEDNGVGMSEEQLARARQSFYSTKASGSGLGLSISESIVKELGGTLTLASEVGRGTSATVQLLSPQQSAPDEEAPQRLERSAETPELSRELKLLVMDDEPLIIRSIASALGPRARVLPATSVTQAQTLLSLNRDIDVILADVVMPDGGGSALFLWVRNQMPHLQQHFGFITGMAAPSSLPAEAEQAPRLAKPFNRSELVSFVGKLAEIEEGPEWQLVEYELDARDRLTRVNGEWDLFADSNGAPELFGRGILGRNVFDFMGDELTKSLYRRLYEHVRSTKNDVSFTFRCDSPRIERRLRMTISAKGVGSLSVTNKVVETRFAPLLRLPAYSRTEVPSAVRVCSICAKVHWDHAWSEVEVAVSRGFVLGSDTRFMAVSSVCEECQAIAGA